jgi:hypothetical protein
MTSFVVMDRDRRTYRFLKDTRLGRTVILESPDLDAMADMITSYVAERIIERERAMEGDWLLRKTSRAEEPTRRRTMRNLASTLAGAEPVEAPGRQVMGWVVAAFLGGLLIGLIALAGYALIAGAA